MKQTEMRRKNQKISYQTREQLIRLVTEQRLTIREAGQRLGFRPSTAKMIIKKYRINGKITKFRVQPKKTELQQDPQISYEKQSVIWNRLGNMNFFGNPYFISIHQIQPDVLYLSQIQTSENCWNLSIFNPENFMNFYY